MTEPLSRRLARRALTHRVRGHAPRPDRPPLSERRGSDWGEAMLAEFEQTEGGWAAVRWAAGCWWAARAVDPLPRSTRLLRRLVTGVAALAVLAFPVNAYAASFGYIPSGGMAPTLQIEDRIVIDKVGFRIGGVRHGDVVVLEYLDTRMVKRVLGLPGDTISCRDGALLRDGAVVIETYEPPGAVTECATVTVPAGSLYLLGDNREVSADSRRWGPVPASTVVGRVVGRF
jgi:signal peptidase I